MTTYKCIKCGNENAYKNTGTVCECGKCKTTMPLPMIQDSKVEGLYSSANDYFRAEEYDKAMGLYEQILREYGEDAALYWMLLLCTYGIHYCRSNDSEEWKPTINRFQPSRVIDNPYYKYAMRLGKKLQNDFFIMEGKELETIRAKIEEITRKELPVDVFISYKEKVDNKATYDSDFARTLYNYLKEQGLKVFYAPITLKGKAGESFEPYIYAAIHSAKAMIVLGTKPEYFTSLWIQNEWNRFIPVAKESNGSKLLIPVYRGMEPTELPKDLQEFQGIDMREDYWLRRVKDRINKVMNPLGFNQYPVLELASEALEEGEFEQAAAYCDELLKWKDANNAMAYVGKLMADLHLRKLSELSECKEPFDTHRFYKKAYAKGDANVKATLESIISRINERNEYNRQKAIYDEADALMKKKSEEGYRQAEEKFRLIPGFDDADEKCKECGEKAEMCRKDKIYNDALTNMQQNTIAGYSQAIKQFRSIRGWHDSRDQILLCCQKIRQIQEKTNEKRYGMALEILRSAKTRQEYLKASEILDGLKDYRGSHRLREYCSTMADQCFGVDKNAQMNDLLIQNNEVIESIRKEIVLKDHPIQMHWTIPFGRYVQEGDEPTPILWHVLAIEGNTLLLISEYALDCKCYNEKNEYVTWKTCTLRQWLNSDFLNTAFTEEEKEMIQVSHLKNEDNLIYGTSGGEETKDKVFLLSIEEAQRYFPNDEARQCKPTANAVAKGAYVDNDNGNCWWWLRSPGTGSRLAAFVSYDGSLIFYGYWVNGSVDAVRPSLRIHL